MIAKAMGILLLVVSAGCASQNSTQAAGDRCTGLLNQQFESGQITRLERARGLRECNLAAFPNNPYANEYWDYFVYVAGEVESGRISLDYGRMLISRKETEINERRAALVGAMQPQPVLVYPAYGPPSCRALPPGTAGYARAQGQCY